MTTSGADQGGGRSGVPEAPEPATGPAKGGVPDLPPEMQDRLDQVVAGSPSDEPGGEASQIEDWPVPKPEDIKLADPYQSYHGLPGDEPSQDQKR